VAMREPEPESFSFHRPERRNCGRFGASSIMGSRGNRGQPGGVSRGVGAGLVWSSPSRNAALAGQYLSKVQRV
jgi:hypothetical protein